MTTVIWNNKTLQPCKINSFHWKITRNHWKQAHTRLSLIFILYHSWNLPYAAKKAFLIFFPSTIHQPLTLLPACIGRMKVNLAVCDPSEGGQIIRLVHPNLEPFQNSLWALLGQSDGQLAWTMCYGELPAIQLCMYKSLGCAPFFALCCAYDLCLQSRSLGKKAQETYS